MENTSEMPENHAKEDLNLSVDEMKKHSTDDEEDDAFAENQKVYLRQKSKDLLDAQHGSDE